jgi:hypothetical protein
MAELGWTMLEVTQEHRKNLVSQGYMMAAELVTCHVPKDPEIPHSGGGGGGYIVACTTIYEWEFGVPSHQFLYSLLQFYGPVLHHLTPSGNLHMSAFVTLCEA